jgi:hypothetical protein
MSHHWGAYITTVDNRLEYVEFETPGISRSAAIAQVKSMYGAKSVSNCNPVSTSSSDSDDSPSSSGGSSGSVEGAFGLAIIVGMIWALITFLPWILMGLGGWFGAWAGNKTGKVSLAIMLSLLAGGFGYYQGDQWQQEWNSDSTVEQVQQ